MSDFKTSSDILRALADGKRLRMTTWPEGKLIRLKGGHLIDENKWTFPLAFEFPEQWSLAPDPPLVVEFEGVMKTYSDQNGEWFGFFGNHEECKVMTGRRWRVVATEVKEG